MKFYYMQNSTSDKSSICTITIRRYFITGSQRLSNFFLASLIFFGGAGFLLTGFFSFFSRVTVPVHLKTEDVPFFEVEKSKSDPVHFREQEENLPYTALEKVGLDLPNLSNEESTFAKGNEELQIGSVRTPEEGNPLFPRRGSEQNVAFFPQRGSEQKHVSTGLDDAYTNRGFETKGTNSSIRFFPQGLIMCFYGSLGLIFSLYLWSTILWKVGNGFNEFNKEKGVVRIFRWGLPGKNRQIDFSYPLKNIEALRVSLKEGINPRRSIALQIKGKGEIPLTRIGEPIPLQDIENQASELANFLKVEIQVIQI